MSVQFCGKYPSSNLHSLLYENEFYNEDNYVKTTKEAFGRKRALPATYKTESLKTIRIVKKILSIIIFPVFLYNAIHSLVGMVVIPSSIMFSKSEAAKLRAKINIEHSDWKYYRFTVDVDGHKIDAMLMGKKENLKNRRWTLASLGNGFCYEQVLSGYQMGFGDFLEETKSNALLFNYSGVGASSSFPNKKTIMKAYQAMFAILEDNKDGIGAEEIIGYGHSLGGGVQGEFLKGFFPKTGISYVFVKIKNIF